MAARLRTPLVEERDNAAAGNTSRAVAGNAELTERLAASRSCIAWA
jgi:hypothetical protein